MSAIDKHFAVSGKTKECLVDIVSVLAGEDYNYYKEGEAGFEIRKIAATDRAPIKIIMAVIVPESQRVSASMTIEQELNKLVFKKRPKYNILVSDDQKQMDIYLGNTIDVKDKIRLLIKPTKGGGSGGGAAQTAINESSQCLYASLAFNVFAGNIVPDAVIKREDLESAAKYIEVDASLEEMLLLSNVWKKSSILGANKLYDTIKPSKGEYKFYRGKGIDAEINKAYKLIKQDKVAKQSDSIKEQVPDREDKWNPADIWIARKTFDSGTIATASKPKLVLNFNAFLIREFNSGNLYGVSLKKMEGTAHINPRNLTKDRNLDGVGYQKYSFNYESKDTYIEFPGGGKCQFRNFDSGKGSWQGEMKGTQANQGKIGGGAVWAVLKAHKVKYSIRADQGQQFYVDCGSQNQQNTIAKEIYNLLTKFPADDRSKSNMGTETQEVDDIVANGQRWMYTKFLGLTLIDAIAGADNSDEIVQDIYLYASSQHKLSGCYYKLE